MRAWVAVVGLAANAACVQGGAPPSQDDLAGVYDNIGSKIGFEEAQTEIGYWFAAIAAILILASGGLSLLWFNRFP